MSIEKTKTETLKKEGMDNYDEIKHVEFSHKELVNLTKEAISKIIESDPFFDKLPLDPTVDEIKAQAAVVQGQAITLFLNRGELVRLPIVVPLHNTTVLDLKKAVKRHTNLSLRRQNISNKISWKFVWKKYCLSFGDIKLLNDKENIKNYGIRNKDELRYSKIYNKKIKYQNI